MSPVRLQTCCNPVSHLVTSNIQSSRVHSQQESVANRFIKGQQLDNPFQSISEHSLGLAIALVQGPWGLKCWPHGTPLPVPAFPGLDFWDVRHVAKTPRAADWINRTSRKCFRISWIPWISAPCSEHLSFGSARRVAKETAAPCRRSSTGRIHLSDLLGTLLATCSHGMWPRLL